MTRWLSRTPVHTFFLIPLLVILFELVMDHLVVVPWGIPLMVWGFLQYRLVGRFRHPIAGGSPGMEVLPGKLVRSGPYRFSRNPMYLGHLIFMLGLAVTLWSWFALLLLAGRAVWFHTRVLHDEARLRQKFGDDYSAYCAKVSRWVPGLI